MKTLAVALLVLAVVAQDTYYPFVSYSGAVYDSASENKEVMGPRDIVDELKLAVDRFHPNFLAVVVMEGLNTEALSMHADHMPNMKEMMQQNVQVFPKLQTGFDYEEFTTVFTDARAVQIDNEEQANLLLDHLKEAEVTEGQTIVYLIKMKTTPFNHLDRVVKSVYETLAHKGSTIISLTGRGQVSPKRILALNQASSHQVKLISSTNITDWIVPAALSGLFIAFFLIIVFMCGLLQMMAIQPPYLFLPQGIDFGKIEK